MDFDLKKSLKMETEQIYRKMCNAREKGLSKEYRDWLDALSRINYLIDILNNNNEIK